MSRRSVDEFDEDNDSDSENEEGEQAVERMNHNLVLRDFFRLIAGPRGFQRENAADNAELVNILKELNLVRSQRLERALLTCPRAIFIPPEYADAAYEDAPIRVESMGFNISAPHMHATCLQALDVQPGEKFLDVGSGCGIVAACGAYLVGPTGECVAAEIKQQILDFSIFCLEKLRQSSLNYVRESCEVEFLLKNAFIPISHKHYFDKIHVGGSCPEDRLPSLIRMLKPTGGKMTVPVGQDLRLITTGPNGPPQQHVLTQVRFSELTVPSDADIVLTTMESAHDQKLAVDVPPSTLPDDAKLVRSLMNEHGENGKGLPSTSRKVKRSLSSLLGLKNEETEMQNSPKESSLDMSQLDEPDCALVGDGWRVGAHRAVLKVRCDYFRARFDSQMQDSLDDELEVPAQFSQESMSLLIRYIYKDTLPEDLTAQMVIDLLHVACYYGVPRLVILCESYLAKELMRQHEMNSEEAAELAIALLALADSNGLSSLQSVVVHYMAKHVDLIRNSKSYGQLTRREVDLILQECFSNHERFKKYLAELSGSDDHR